ncbi:hypothetical protein VKT23_017953 [Stygiomarasmius scandens]|uniref:Uncharacterized protein n=1 Tax=Marasmiellus scandens TaxID=2682957 RepID=A0ABR1IQL6_9AGAR
MASISFRARPGATVRLLQTVSGPSLRMEDSGVSTTTTSGNELDIQVHVNNNGLSLSVVSASGSTSPDVSTQGAQSFSCAPASNWESAHTWNATSIPEGQSFPDPLYTGDNMSFGAHHDDIIELGNLLSSLPSPPSHIDQVGLDIPFDMSYLLSSGTPAMMNGGSNVEETQSIFDYSEAAMNPQRRTLLRQVRRIWENQVRAISLLLQALNLPLLARGGIPDFHAEPAVAYLPVNTPEKFMKTPMPPELQDLFYAENLTARQHFLDHTIDCGEH